MPRHTPKKRRTLKYLRVKPGIYPENFSESRRTGVPREAIPSIYIKPETNWKTQNVSLFCFSFIWTYLNTCKKLLRSGTLPIIIYLCGFHMQKATSLLMHFFMYFRRVRILNLVGSHASHGSAVSENTMQRRRRFHRTPTNLFCIGTGPPQALSTDCWR